MDSGRAALETAKKQFTELLGEEMRVSGLGLGVSGLGFGFMGLEFGVQARVYRVGGLGCGGRGLRARAWAESSEFRYYRYTFSLRCSSFLYTYRAPEFRLKINSSGVVAGYSLGCRVYFGFRPSAVFATLRVHVPK